MRASTFRALGEPSRLQIVELLRGGPSAVGEIAEVLSIRQPQVSKHLRVLSDSGIVAVEAVARHRIYHLESEPFDEMERWVESFERVWETRLDALDRHLEALRGGGDTKSDR